MLERDYINCWGLFKLQTWRQIMYHCKQKRKGWKLSWYYCNIRETYCNTIINSKNFPKSHPYSVISYHRECCVVRVWSLGSRGRWEGEIIIKRFFFFLSYYFCLSVFFRWLMVIGIAFEGFALVWYLALLANAKPCKLLE